MEKSSYRFSVSNIIFYILSIASAGLLAACTGMETFGDSSKYCTIFQLGKCSASTQTYPQFGCLNPLRESVNIDPTQFRSM